MDIIKHINLLNNVSFTPDIIEDIIASVEKKTITLNIQDLFNQIIQIGKTRWFSDGKKLEDYENCGSSNEPECIGYALIKGMDRLVNSGGFQRFSDTIEGVLEKPSLLKDNKILEQDQEVKKDSFDNLIKLFESTLTIMNPIEDLSNSSDSLLNDSSDNEEPKTKVDTINLKLDDLYNFFNETEAGGPKLDTAANVFLFFPKLALCTLGFFLFGFGGINPDALKFFGKGFVNVFKSGNITGDKGKWYVSEGEAAQRELNNNYKPPDKKAERERIDREERARNNEKDVERMMAERKARIANYGVRKGGKTKQRNSKTKQRKTKQRTSKQHKTKKK